MTDDGEHMVERFLTWRLAQPWHPDAETDISRYLPITLANWIDAGVHNTRQDT